MQRLYVTLPGGRAEILDQPWLWGNVEPKWCSRKHRRDKKWQGETYDSCCLITGTNTRPEGKFQKRQLGNKPGHVENCPSSRRCWPISQRFTCINIRSFIYNASISCYLLYLYLFRTNLENRATRVSFVSSSYTWNFGLKSNKRYVF